MLNDITESLPRNRKAFLISCPEGIVEAQECDATGDDSSNEVWFIEILKNKQQIKI